MPPPEYHQWGYYRATRSFTIGNIRYSVREGEHVWFDGRSLCPEGSYGQMDCPAVLGAIGNGWLVKIDHAYLATPFTTKEAFTSLDGFAILKKHGWDILTVRCQTCSKEVLANEIQAHQCVEAPRLTSWEHLVKDE